MCGLGDGTLSLSTGDAGCVSSYMWQARVYISEVQMVRGDLGYMCSNYNANQLSAMASDAPMVGQSQLGIPITGSRPIFQSRIPGLNPGIGDALIPGFRDYEK